MLGEGAGGGTYSYAGSAVRAAAMAGGTVGSAFMGRASQVMNAAGKANAKGGPLGVKVARGIGYYIGNESKQAIGAAGKGLKAGYKGSLGRVVSSANRNIVQQAAKTYKNAMNRQDSEIKTGGKVTSATAKAAGATYRFLRDKFNGQ